MTEELDEFQKSRREIGLDDINIEGDPNKKNKSPEDDEDDSEEDDDDESDDDNDDDSEDDEDDDDQSDNHDDRDNKNYRGIPSKAFNDVRSQLRDEREKREALQARLDEMEKAKGGVDDNKIVEAAKAMLPSDATVEQVEATKFQIKKILELTGSNNSLAEKKMAELDERLAQINDKETFNNEWSDFESTIKQNYKDINPKQVKLAQKAMDELAHAPQFADKEFDYVYFKNRDIFDEIFKSRPKKTFESRDTYLPNEENDEDEDFSNFDPKRSSIDKVLKFQDKLKQEANRQDNETGWHVMHNGKHIS